MLVKNAAKSNQSGVNLNGATTATNFSFVVRFIIRKVPSIPPSFVFITAQLV